MMARDAAGSWRGLLVRGVILGSLPTGRRARSSHTVRWRLTFPKGALLKDPKHVFNTRLDSATVRAVDFREGDMVSEAALRALIRQAVELNTSKARTR